MKVGAGAIRGSDPGSSAGARVGGVNVREWWGVTLGPGPSHTRPGLWDSDGASSNVRHS